MAVDLAEINVSLLSPVSDVIAGASVPIDLIFGRAGNDIFYGYDPIVDANDKLNIDILFGDTFDNTPDEFVLTQFLTGFVDTDCIVTPPQCDGTGTTFIPADPFAILNPFIFPDGIPSIGADRFVLGDEFQPYYTSSNPGSLLTTNLLGFNEFALIYDFDPNEDTIQLNGNKDDYLLLKVGPISIGAVTPFSGYLLFSLHSGIPDAIGVIPQRPEVELLELDEEFGFLLVGDKPKKKPKEKNILQFSTAGLDYGYAATTDAVGNLYVAGTTNGALNGPNQGSSDIWVNRYDVCGEQTLALQLGSNTGDTVTEIITDEDGNFYLAGSTSGEFVDVLKSISGTDAWVAKYDEDGNMLWGRQFGSDKSSTEIGDEFGFSTSAFGLQLDAMGNVYVSGLTINTNNFREIFDFPVEDDPWLIKLNGETGENLWTTSTKIKATGQDFDLMDSSPVTEVLRMGITPFFDESYDLATDAFGNSYLVGWTQGLTRESDPIRFLQKYDVWLSKVDTNGQVEWVRQLGSDDFGEEFGWTVDTDNGGNIYISGWTTGAIGDESTTPAERDVFLAKYDPAGQKQWVKQFGSPGDDGQFLSDMYIDSNDNIFVTGYTDDQLGSGDADESINAWIGRFDTDGNALWIQQIGVEGKADYATGVTAFGERVFVTGFTEGLLGISSSSTAGSAFDGWLAELDIDKGKVQKFGECQSDSKGSKSSKSSKSSKKDKPTPPNGGSFPPPWAYYGNFISGLSPFFDPSSDSSLQASLIRAVLVESFEDLSN